MKYGIIDIGTNTIRSAIYELDKNISSVKDIVFESEILKYTENEILTNAGIESLKNALLKSVVFFKAQNCENFSCFATSAMRDIKNFSLVFKETKEIVPIVLLSEKNEAECDFYALLHEVGKKCTGAGIDLGGGSCQLLYFSEGKLIKYKSAPLGVKRLYRKYGDFNLEINENIKNLMLSEFEEFSAVCCDTLYIMGGSAKLIKKMADLLMQKKDYSLTKELLNKISEQLFLENELFLNACKDRKKTIPYALGLITALCEFLNATKAQTLSVGVKEGYILKNCLHTEN